MGFQRHEMVRKRHHCRHSVHTRGSLSLVRAYVRASRQCGTDIVVVPQLLAPAFDALSSPCLGGAWKEYDWAPAIAMASVFGIFLVELVATRAGASFLKKRGLRHHDPHHSRGNEVGHTGHGSHPPAKAVTTALAEEGAVAPVKSIVTIRSAEQEEEEETAIGSDLEAAGDGAKKDVEAGNEAHVHGHAHSHHDGSDDEDDYLHDSAVAQCIGVAILEFGVIFHVSRTRSSIRHSFSVYTDIRCCVVLRDRSHSRRHRQYRSAPRRLDFSPNVRRRRSRESAIDAATPAQVQLW